MKKTTLGIVALVLVGAVLLSGLVAAQGGSGPQATPTDDRPLDGSNSPWVTEDERLDRFQERFNLTDAQMDELKSTVRDMIEDGADRDEVRATVVEMLEDYGVDVTETDLGPRAAAERPMDGTGFQRGAGHGPAWADDDDRRRGGGGGPHGPGNPDGPRNGQCPYA